MTTWAAAISNETASGNMDVCVIVCEQEWDGEKYQPVLTDALAVDPVGLGVPASEAYAWDRAEQAAVDELADRGWGITGDWDYADNAAYATAIPAPGNPLREQWTPEDEEPV